MQRQQIEKLGQEVNSGKVTRGEIEGRVGVERQASKTAGRHKEFRAGRSAERTLVEQQR